MLSHNPEEFGVVVENDEETNYRQIEEIECSEGRGFEVSSKTIEVIALDWMGRHGRRPSNEKSKHENCAVCETITV